MTPNFQGSNESSADLRKEDALEDLRIENMFLVDVNRGKS